MAYEVTAAESASQERLVVSVAGKTLVVGEPLDEDRNAEGVVILADDSYEGDADLASELALISERVPEVAEAVSVEYVPEPVEIDAATPAVVVEVGPAPDPPDQVVEAGETTPSITRTEVNVDEGEEPDVVIDPATPEGAGTVEDSVDRDDEDGDR